MPWMGRDVGAVQQVVIHIRPVGRGEGGEVGLVAKAFGADGLAGVVERHGGEGSEPLALLAESAGSQCGHRTRIQPAAEGDADGPVAAQAVAHGPVVDLQEALHIRFPAGQAQFRRILQPPVAPDARPLGRDGHGVGRGQALDVQVDGLRPVVGGPGDEHLRQVEFVEAARRADGVERRRGRTQMRTARPAASRPGWCCRGGRGPRRVCVRRAARRQRTNPRSGDPGLSFAPLE
jgi:hypothetical protein